MVGYTGEDRCLMTRCMVIVFLFFRRLCAFVLPVSRMPRRGVFLGFGTAGRRALASAFSGMLSGFSVLLSERSRQV